MGKRQTDRRMPRSRRWSGSRPAALPTGCSSPGTSPTCSDFLRELDPAVPVMALGLGSNLIVRDGGVPGVVVRLGKAFATVEPVDDVTLDCGGGASGILVSSHGARCRHCRPRIPALDPRHRRRLRADERRRLRQRSQGHAGRLRRGAPLGRAGHAAGRRPATTPTAIPSLPEGAIVVAARFRGRPGEPAAIQAEMDRIAASREARSRCAARPAARPSRTRPRRRKGLGAGRCGRLPRAQAGRGASQREAHQFPDQRWPTRPAPTSKGWARRCGGA